METYREQASFRLNGSTELRQKMPINLNVQQQTRLKQMQPGKLDPEINKHLIIVLVRRPVLWAGN